MKAADTRSMQLAIAETVRDGVGAFEQGLGEVAPNPTNGPGGRLTIDGQPAFEISLGGAEGAFDGPGRGFKGFVVPNRNQVYVMEIGGFAGETTRGPLNLETTAFPRNDYSADDVAAMQRASKQLPAIEAGPNIARPAPEPAHRGGRVVFDQDDFGGNPGGIFAEINERAGGNI